MHPSVKCMRKADWSVQRFPEEESAVSLDEEDCLLYHHVSVNLPLTSSKCFLVLFSHFRIISSILVKGAVNICLCTSLQSEWRACNHSASCRYKHSAHRLESAASAKGLNIPCKMPEAHSLIIYLFVIQNWIFCSTCNSLSVYDKIGRFTSKCSLRVYSTYHCITKKNPKHVVLISFFSLCNSRTCYEPESARCDRSSNWPRVGGFDCADRFLGDLHTKQPWRYVNLKWFQWKKKDFHSDIDKWY